MQSHLYQRVHICNCNTSPASCIPYNVHRNKQHYNKIYQKSIYGQYSRNLDENTHEALVHSNTLKNNTWHHSLYYTCCPTTCDNSYSACSNIFYYSNGHLRMITLSQCCYSSLSDRCHLVCRSVRCHASRTPLYQTIHIYTATIVLS